MKIAILSDSHDHYDNLANDLNCQKLLFAGDLIAPGNGSAILSKFNGTVHFIFGNNDGEEFGMTKQFTKYDNLSIEGKWFELEVEGKKIFMNHYPRIAEIAAKSGIFDIVIYGHDHIQKHEKIGDTILLNPGALHPYKIKEPSFAIYDTTSNSVEIVTIT